MTGVDDGKARERKGMAVLMAAFLLLSSLLGGGLLLLASFGTAASGFDGDDWIIDSEVSISDLTSYGNITITSNGSLTITDGHLLMASNYLEGRNLSISISDGGTLRLDNALLGSLLTFSAGSSPVLSILVENGGRLIVENGSTLKFPGHILVDDAELIVKDSVIRGMAGSASQDNTGDIAYYCDQEVFPAANFSHSPVINIISSYFLLQNSSILDMHEGGALDPGAWTAGYGFVQDDDQRDSVSYNISRYPSSFNGTVDAADLQALDQQVHEIPEGSELNITGFDMGGLMFSAGEATVSLHVVYRTGDAFGGSADLEVGRELAYADAGDLLSTWGPLGNGDARLDVALPDMASWEYADLMVRIQNTLGNGDAIGIDRLWLSVQMDVPTFGNLTLMGDSRLMLIDSYMDVDHSNADSLAHNALVLRDDAQAELYGFSCEVGVGQPFADSIVLEPHVVDLLPGNATENDSTTNPQTDLYWNDTYYYEVNPGEIAELSINTTGLNSTLSQVQLLAGITSSYTALNTLQWSVNGYSFNNTSIVPPSTGTQEYTFTLPLDSTGDISNLLIRFENLGVSTVNINYILIEAATNSQVNIYKWADVLVSNDYQALEGITVEAFTQTSAQPAEYRDGDNWTNSPPQAVLDYLRRGADYNVTDSDGALMMPLLVDILNGSTGQPVRSYTYNLVASALSAGGPITGQSGASFLSYPYLSSASNDDTHKAVGIMMSDALPDLEVLSMEVRDYAGDLVVPSVPGAPLPVQRTDSLSLTINVTNNGPVPATNFQVQIYDDMNLLQAFNVSYIDAWNGSSPVVTLYYDWTVGYPLGSHNLSVVSDPLYSVVEMDEDNNVHLQEVDVLPAPEIVLGAPQLLVNGTGSYLQTSISNMGDVATGAFDVEFRINGAFNASVGVDNISASGSTVVSLAYAQPSAGPLSVQVQTSNSSNHLLNGINASNDLGVDLAVGALNLQQTSFYTVGQTVSVTFTVSNSGAYAASNVTIRLQLLQEGLPFSVKEQSGLYIGANSSIALQETWPNITPTMGSQWVDFTLVVTVNPDHDIPEESYADNQATRNFIVNDNRPDLALLWFSTSEGGSGPQGKMIQVFFQVDNLGSTAAASPMLTVYLDNGTAVQVLNITLAPIAAGDSINSSVSWTIRGDAGDYQLVGYTNEFGTTPDRNSSNNQVSIGFEVMPLVPGLNMDSNLGSYKVGDIMVVWGTLANLNNNTEKLADATVILTVRGDNGQLINTYTLTTDGNGYFRQEIPVTELMAGTSTIGATASYGTESVTLSFTRSITSGITDGGGDWWMWIVIILVMLLIIIVFSIYIYRYSISKMVECGECHSLIPEASHRCPNCGVDFEVGTAKCSECGAWIPANSKKCPECGASFIGTIVSDEEESDYIQLMREGYGLYVDTFRAMAKEELGKKYNDQRFLRWWTEHPEHITFEEWLAKEEASRKEQTFKCPSCGTMNVKGAKQCIRCNRSFVRPTGSILEDEPKPAAPVRRVVRKRKVPSTPSEPQEEPSEKEGEEPVMKKRTVLRKKDEGKEEEDSDEARKEGE